MDNVRLRLKEEYLLKARSFTLKINKRHTFWRDKLMQIKQGEWIVLFMGKITCQFLMIYSTMESAFKSSAVIHRNSIENNNIQAWIKERSMFRIASFKTIFFDLKPYSPFANVPNNRLGAFQVGKISKSLKQKIEKQNKEGRLFKDYLFSIYHDKPNSSLRIRPPIFT